MEPAFDQDGVTIYEGDCRESLANLPEESVDCCVTSPPYWGLRDYGTATWEGGDRECNHSVGGQVQDTKAPGAITTGQRPGVDASRCRKCGAIRNDPQIGLESTPEEYVEKMVAVFREVRRVLKPEGTLWLNLGDSYSGQGGTQSAPGKTALVGSTKRGVQTRSASNGKASRVPPVGLKAKDLVGIPWMVAFALRADGWYLRSDIIWHKPNPMPESTKDRPTKAHEYIFLMSKSRKYHYDFDAIAEECIESNDSRPRMGQGPNTQYKQKRKKMKMPDGWDTGEGGHGSFHRNGREKGKADNADVPDKKNKRTVWTIPTEPYPEAHFATFPQKLIEPCILAGCPAGGTVLDPFTGSGTTAVVAQRNGCRFIGCEVNPDYIKLIAKRFRQRSLFAPAPD